MVAQTKAFSAVLLAPSTFRSPVDLQAASLLRRFTRDLTEVIGKGIRTKELDYDTETDYRKDAVIFSRYSSEGKQPLISMDRLQQIIQGSQEIASGIQSAYLRDMAERIQRVAETLKAEDEIHIGEIEVQSKGYYSRADSRSYTSHNERIFRYSSVALDAGLATFLGLNIGPVVGNYILSDYHLNLLKAKTKHIKPGGTHAQEFDQLKVGHKFESIGYGVYVSLLLFEDERNKDLIHPQAGFLSLEPKDTQWSEW